MRIEITGSILALLLLAGCSGGMDLGGEQLNASDQAAVGDDPLDDGAVNDGVGNVIN